MSKVNQMLVDWKTGDVHGLEWLREKGIDQRLAYSYFESGYLNKIGPGVFTKKNDQINPLALARFLQEELHLKLHVSGRSALELQGLGHYVPLGENQRFQLTSYEDRAFPSWVSKLEKSFELIFKKSSLLVKESYLSTFEDRHFDIKISSRELAILELINSLELSNSLETVENYTESLSTLRPEVLQELLEECRSVKVKRVFLYVSEKLGLGFFAKLDLSRISLGNGKRVIVKDGMFDKKYQITVDRDYGENPF